VQRPIPLWMGGMAERVLKRIARIADGWFPQFTPGPEQAETVERLRGYVTAAGRRVEDVGIEGRINLVTTPEERWGGTLQSWRELGASHVSFNTMGANLHSPQGHIEVIKRFKEIAGG
jgi:alkanesulfonate monooxygenase SsuD/methylene tetrahydromethanopterin reductase-like flavin-dependent oxidoreductase (luciferase family)